MGRRTRIAGRIEEETKARATFTNPDDIAGLGLWYDWQTATTGSSTVTDSSGEGRTGTYSAIGGAGIFEDLDGEVKAYVGGNQYWGFTSISARTVIRCLTVPEIAYFLMSSSSTYPFHRQQDACCNVTFAHANVQGGTWRINGNAIADPTATDISAYWYKPMIVSCVTATAGVSVDRIGFDRSSTPNPAIQYEDLVWTTALTAAQVKLVEHYLAVKHGVSGFNFEG